MDNTSLQNQIIRKILHTSNKHLLEYLDTLLSKENSKEVYPLNDFEKQILNESNVDYSAGRVISNDEVFKKLETMLA